MTIVKRWILLVCLGVALDANAVNIPLVVQRYQSGNLGAVQSLLGSANPGEIYNFWLAIKGDSDDPTAVIQDKAIQDLVMNALASNKGVSLEALRKQLADARSGQTTAHVGQTAARLLAAAAHTKQTQAEEQLAQAQEELEAALQDVDEERNGRAADAQQAAQEQQRLSDLLQKTQLNLKAAVAAAKVRQQALQEQLNDAQQQFTQIQSTLQGKGQETAVLQQEMAKLKQDLLAAQQREASAAQERDTKVQLAQAQQKAAEVARDEANRKARIAEASVVTAQAQANTVIEKSFVQDAARLAAEKARDAALQQATASTASLVQLQTDLARALSELQVEKTAHANAVQSTALQVQQAITQAQSDAQSVALGAQQREADLNIKLFAAQKALDDARRDVGGAKEALQKDLDQVRQELVAARQGTVEAAQKQRVAEVDRDTKIATAVQEATRHQQLAVQAATARTQAEHDRDAHKARADGLDQDLTGVRAELAQIQTALATERSGRESDKSAAASALARALAAAQADTNAAALKEQNLQQQLAVAQQTLTQLQTDLGGKNTQLATELAQAQLALQKATADMQSAQAQASSSDSARDLAEREKAGALQAAEQHKKLATQATVAQQAAEAAKQQAEHDRDAHKARADGLDQDLAGVRAELAQIQTALAAEKSGHENDKSVAVTLASTLATAQTELQAAEIREAHLRQQLQTAQNTLTLVQKDLNGKNAALATQLAQVQHDLSRSLSDVVSAQKDAESARQQKNEHMHHAAKLQSDLTESTRKQASAEAGALQARQERETADTRAAEKFKIQQAAIDAVKVQLASIKEALGQITQMAIIADNSSYTRAETLKEALKTRKDIKPADRAVLVKAIESLFDRLKIVQSPAYQVVQTAAMQINVLLQKLGVGSSDITAGKATISHALTTPPRLAPQPNGAIKRSRLAPAR